MKTIIEHIKSELFDSWFGLVFILFGLTIQYVTYQITESSLLSLISGSSGVISVVLCSQRKFAFYLFGWIQLITYVILAYEQKLYGELIENGFYAIMMIWGMFVWTKNYNREDNEVFIKELTPMQLFNTIITMVGSMAILLIILTYTDDTQPFMDTVTTVPAFIAQIMLTLRYREQWIFWFIIDVGSIIMWSIAGDYCLAAQFVFWTLNCIYGFYKWSN